MNRFLLLTLILVFIVACKKHESDNTRLNVIFHLPYGNGVILKNDSTLGKDQISQLQVEYAGLYDSAALNQTCPDLSKGDIGLAKSYYFSEDQTNFYNLLDKGHTFSCMGLLEAKNETFDLYLIKSIPARTDVAEGKGYVKHIYLVSVSKKTTEIINVLNIYNDGMLLYWESMRLFYIDTNLNVTLKDVSITEGKYKVWNKLNFIINNEGHFIQKDNSASENHPIVTQSKSETWEGTYNFTESIMRGIDEFKIKYTLNVESSQKVNVITQVNEHKAQQFLADAIIINSDNLVIKYKNNEQNEEVILYKIGDKYEIGGKSIYLLNPPNDRYSIQKQL